MAKHRAPLSTRLAKNARARTLGAVGVLAVAAAAATTLTTTASAAAGDPSLCDATSGNLVQNCGFETGSFSSWTSSGGAQSVRSDPSYVNSGNYGAALGFVRADGTTTQVVTVPTAGTYSFRYYEASDGAQPNDFSSSITDSTGKTTVFESLVNEDSHPFELHSFSVSLPAGSTTVQFAARNDPAYNRLDDVVLVSSAPVKKKTYSKITPYGKTPYTNGQQVTFYDYVTSDAYKKNTHPTGTVTFQYDSEAPVTKPLATAGVQSSQAYFIKKVTNGTHTLRATYNPGADDQLGDQTSVATYTFTVGSPSSSPTTPTTPATTPPTTTTTAPPPTTTTPPPTSTTPSSTSPTDDPTFTFDPSGDPTINT